MVGFIREHVLKRLRSGKWRKVRKNFIKANPNCAICGKRKFVHVHHKIPVHIDKDKELDFSNLVTLCPRHHFIIGHLENWRKYNPNIDQDIQWWRKRLKEVK